MKHKRGMRFTRIICVLFATMTLGLLLAGCGGAGSSSGPVDITYTYLNGSYPDQQAVQDALNKVLVPAINVRVTLKPLDWSSFDQKTRLNFAAGKPCDVIWTASWMNNYYQDVINGNLMSLDDLLPKYAPKLYASMPSFMWQAPKFRGHIYGVINQQIFPPQTGFIVRKDLVDKYHFDLNSVKTWSDLEPFLQEIKDHESGVVPVMSDNTNTSLLSGILPYDTVTPGIGVRFGDKTRHLVSMYESPEYKQAVELTHQWYQKGYLKDPDTQGFQNYDQGKYAVILGQTIKPGGDIEFERGHPNYKIYQHPMLPPVVTTGSTAGTMTAICASSKHPVEAMKFIEELNSDPAVINTIAYGVQGKDWTWVNQAQKVIKLTPGNDPKNPNYSTFGPWMFGNTFNAYYTDVSQVGSWEETKKINDSAQPSPLLGFNFDPTPVRTQIASLGAVIAQDFTGMQQGIVDPATQLPKAIQDLKNAGLDQVMAEAQNQVNTWARNK